MCTQDKNIQVDLNSLHISLRGAGPLFLQLRCHPWSESAKERRHLEGQIHASLSDLLTG